jgi:DNA-repair protein complementing XP-A cells
MKLYLRYQVEAFAFEKWGGGEGLDKEWERRETAKSARKDKERLKKVADLRRRTRTSLWTEERQRKNDLGTNVHEHEFQSFGVSSSKKKCSICRLVIEEEEII